MGSAQVMALHLPVVVGNKGLYYMGLYSLIPYKNQSVHGFLLDDSNPKPWRRFTYEHSCKGVRQGVILGTDTGVLGV